MPAQRPTLFLATDVFGVTAEVVHLANALGADPTIVSPQGSTQGFSSESEGYAAFLEQGGIATYAAFVRRALAARPRPFDLALGFSAGATALWLNLCAPEPWLPRRAELYYGSRIRDHARLRPCCPTRLIFAEQEASFDPAALALRLCCRGVHAELLPGSVHGFMNPRSPGHDARLAEQELRRLKALLG